MIDNIEAVDSLGFWYIIHQKSDQILKKAFHEKFKLLRPKTILIQNSSNFDPSELKNLDYPVIIKTNQSRGLEEAHFIFTAINDDTFLKALRDPALMNKELVIEKLVPHHENFLVKSYVIGD